MTAFTKSSAATRLSNTAATVVGESRPSITRAKSGVMSRFQCDVGFMSRFGPQRAAVARIAQVHRLERQRHLQELLQLRDAALVVLAAAGDGEDHVIVVKAFGVAEAVQCVGHFRTTSSFWLYIFDS